ncbi:MAG: hypothetical protein BWY99_02045 [Synergistetes bacterium ADurb.BinA166]|nr:MAG: hypothetical protein BWY99_02045 [Synergistetes bacterium ADurb.BinA166]
MALTTDDTGTGKRPTLMETKNTQTNRPAMRAKRKECRELIPLPFPTGLEAGA